MSCASWFGNLGLDTITSYSSHWFVNLELDTITGYPSSYTRYLFRILGYLRLLLLIRGSFFILFLLILSEVHTSLLFESIQTLKKNNNNAAYIMVLYQSRYFSYSLLLSRVSNYII